MKLSRNYSLSFNRGYVQPVRTALSLLGIDRNYYKVFCIGFHKTATTSIARVLKDAGLPSLHNVGWNNPRLIYRHFKYRAFSDGSPLHFKWFDERFPNSRFILNTRDLDTWLNSRIEQYGWLRKTGKKSVKDTETSDDVVMSWVRARDDHHRDVLSHFRERPDKLLILNYIRDPLAAQKIARFAGRRAVEHKPYQNTAPAFSVQQKMKNADQIERCLTNLGIPKSEWQNDIYCPSIASGIDPSRFTDDTQRISNISGFNR